MKRLWPDGVVERRGLGRVVGIKGGGVDKKEALLLVCAKPESSFAEAKKAFRRQAMKWHPDRNKAKGAEEKFTQARGAFEWLEKLSDSGHWNDPVSSEGRSATGEKHGATATPAGQPERRMRKTWDPPEGPVFDVGPTPGRTLDAASVAREFFKSFMEIASRAESLGAGARVSARTLSRGFHGFMTFRAWDRTQMAMLKGKFLKAFWERPVPGMFDVMERVREDCADLGWARSIADILNPCCEIHAWGSEVFYIFDEAGKSLPLERLSGAGLSFYKDWTLWMPSLFSGLASNERALRFAMRLRGARAHELFMGKALSRCHQVAELLAPFCVPSQFAAKADWLGLALEAGLDPSALAGWIMSEPLPKLCARLDALGRVKTKKYAQFAEARMEREGQWRLAGVWASGGSILLGKAQRDFDEIVLALSPKGFAGIKIALGLKEVPKKAELQKAVLLGTLEKMNSALGASGKKVVRQALTLGQYPLAVVCAMRMFFDDSAPMDFMLRAQAIERHAGIGELGRSDKSGLNALDWFERAIHRRQALGLA